MMADRTELIDRLCAASKGNRELDQEIHWCLTPPLTEAAFRRHLVVGLNVPHYTTSLDAAASIPGANVVATQRFFSEPDKQICWEAVQESADKSRYIAQAATEALARCAAVLSDPEIGGNDG